MKDLLIKALKLYGLTFVAGFMCFVMVITFNVIGTSFFAEDIGYKMYGSLEKGESEYLYTHYNQDGEDKLKEEYEKKGYELVEYSIPSEIPLSWQLLSQFCLLIMMGIFIYNFLWKLGFKDNNSVRLGLVKEDKLKGLKIGAISTVPPIILLTVLAIGKASFAKGFSFALYGLLNSHIYYAVMLIAGGNPGVFGSLHIWQIICYYGLLLFVPIIAAVSYLLGYKSIIISEKLIYKKNQEN